MNERERFVELMTGPTEAGKVEVWRNRAKELAEKADAQAAEIERLRLILAPFAMVGSDIAKREYPDNHLVSVECDGMRESVERMQEHWDTESAAGKPPPFKRPGPLNWPKECLALDTLSVGHFRAAHTEMPWSRPTLREFIAKSHSNQ